MRYIDTIILHCSDTESGTLESIKKYHMDVKGWKDIGYHFVIEKGGKLRFGRPEEQIGAHCKGYNHMSLGVCLIGKNKFDKKQFDTLRKLVISLKKFYLSIRHVKGHREFESAMKQGKTCPNFSIKEALNER